MIAFIEQPGRVTLVFVRGERESRFMTDSGWRETAVVEIPQPTDGQRIDLEDPGVRVSYRKFQPFSGARLIGSGGVHGHIEVLSYRPDRLTARYAFSVDSVTDQPSRLHEKAAFHGRSTIAAEPRPTGRRFGNVWQRP